MYLVDIFWALTGRIGNNTHHCFSNFFFSTKERDGVAVTLTHFLAISAWHHTHAFNNLFLWLYKCFTVGSIKFCRRLACILYMLLLVLPHGHHLSLIHISQTTRRTPISYAV